MIGKKKLSKNVMFLGNGFKLFTLVNTSKRRVNLFHLYFFGKEIADLYVFNTPIINKEGKPYKIKVTDLEHFLLRKNKEITKNRKVFILNKIVIVI